MKKSVVFYLCWLLTFAVYAQTPSEVCNQNLKAKDEGLNEACSLVPVSVKTLYGMERNDDMLVTHFKPSGSGPFPLLVMNHGRSADNRSKPSRVRYTGIARYWVNRGFAVLVPTRLGYGATAATPDPEDSGRCNNKGYKPMMEAATAQVNAAINFGKSLPWIDTSKVIVMGQSVGGFTSVAASGKQFKGVVAAINFAGGSGGNPKETPENPCQEYKIGDTMAFYGKTSNVPMLWFYAQNDKYWGEKLPKNWHQKYVAAGGKAQFVSLPQIGSATDDGHGAISRTNDFWESLVDVFLQNLGFTISSNQQLPIQVDGLTSSQNETYQRFRAAAIPRAFATAPNGAAGWASGDHLNDEESNASTRALAFCNQRGFGACSLLAIDNQLLRAK